MAFLAGLFGIFLIVVLFSLLITNPIGQLVLFGATVYGSYSFVAANFGEYSESERKASLFPSIVAATIAIIFATVFFVYLTCVDCRCDGFYSGIGKGEFEVNQTGVNIDTENSNSVCGYPGTAVACRHYYQCKSDNPLGNPSVFLPLLVTIFTLSLAVSLFPKKRNTFTEVKSTQIKLQIDIDADNAFKTGTIQEFLFDFLKAELDWLFVFIDDISQNYDLKNVEKAVKDKLDSVSRYSWISSSLGSILFAQHDWSKACVEVRYFTELGRSFFQGGITHELNGLYVLARDNERKGLEGFVEYEFQSSVDERLKNFPGGQNLESATSCIAHAFELLETNYNFVSSKLNSTSLTESIWALRRDIPLLGEIIVCSNSGGFTTFVCEFYEKNHEKYPKLDSLLRDYKNDNNSYQARQASIKKARHAELLEEISSNPKNPCSYREYSTLAETDVEQFNARAKAFWLYSRMFDTSKISCGKSNLYSKSEILILDSLYGKLSKDEKSELDFYKMGNYTFYGDFKNELKFRYQLRSTLKKKVKAKEIVKAMAVEIMSSTSTIKCPSCAEDIGGKFPVCPYCKYKMV